jgi:hypothetical protein
MSAVSAPFGFRSSYNPVGDSRAKKYTIASAYGTAILKNQLVTLNTNGTITAGAAATDILGVFVGCEYTDATGKPNVSNQWPAGQVATNITAWVIDDPTTVFDVQADGSIAQTAIGDQADVSNAAAGSTSTGLSAATLSATLAGAGVQAQFRIVGFNLDQGNTPGDAFTVVQVQIARHQFVSNKVAI